MEANKNENLKVFVGNVPFECTNEEFEQTFAGIEGYIGGEIVKAKFYRGKSSQEYCPNNEAKYNSENSRGFGFVTFNSEENAKKILDRNDIMLKDRTLRFTEYNMKTRKIQTTYDQNEKDKKYSNNTHNYLVVEGVKNLTRNDIYQMFFGQKIGKYFIAVDRKSGEQLDYAIVEQLENLENFVDIIEYNGNEYKVNKKLN